jgi:TusA-related sulfurtransferase
MSEKAEKPPVTLRPREAIMNARKGEIVRAMRDASEAKQPIPVEWVEELAELVSVDIRRR